MKEYREDANTGTEECIYGILDGNYTLFYTKSENNNIISRVYAIVNEDDYLKEIEHVRAGALEILVFLFMLFDGNGFIKCTKQINTSIKYTVTFAGFLITKKQTLT